MGKKRAATLTEQLREFISGSGRNLKELGQASGVDPSQLSRFMRGERGLTTESLDKLCGVLGLRLARERKARPRPAPKE